jgi:hypothetical protein
MIFQLVLQFPLDKETDFDFLIELESKLILKIGHDHLVAGHDIGSGKMNIFILTNDPEAAFVKAKESIDLESFPKLKVAYRTIDAERYRNLWPAGNSEQFVVT